jgi:uncharacterized protein
MKIPREELIPILAQFNPWWRKERIPDLPNWHRGAFSELMEWIKAPPVQRAILLAGPRQVGKTTLLLQAIQRLLDSGVPSGNILYATFDHPICKLAGLDAVIAAWRELEPKADGPEYLFLDEAQFITDIGTWVKHHVDFFKTKRIIFTGSATPLIHLDQESGVGRWHNIQIATLSFFEYLQLTKVKVPEIPQITSLASLHNINLKTTQHLIESTSFLIGHFHEYLMRGGFPQTALVESVTQAQRLLREDIIDKVLKRDMTVLFGVRRIFELERMFIFLCMHDGGAQDTQTIAKELGISKPTVQSFVDLFESAHLIYKIPPFGYGKEILRGKNKLYLADPAIAPAVLIKGKSILENGDALGRCVETTIVGHLLTHCRTHPSHFSYWRNKKNKEVDFIVEIAGNLTPIEVKYHSQVVQKKDVPALTEFINHKNLSQGYVVTKSPDDIGPLSSDSQNVIKIPAALLCYWLGESEFQQRNILLD